MAQGRLRHSQRRIMQALVDKHGTDAEAMAKNSKRNKMLHTGGTLNHMLQAVHLQAGGACAVAATKAQTMVEYVGGC